MVRTAVRTRGVLSALLGAIALVLVGCGDDADGGATPTSAQPVTTASTSTTTSSTTTTTEPADPFAVPDVIDEAYVQRVVDELARIEGDALRHAVDVGPDEVAFSLLDSALGPEEAVIAKNSFLYGQMEGYPHTRRPPGDVVVIVDDVVSASADCIWVRTTQDGSAVSTIAEVDVVVFQQLVPAERNVTGWIIEQAPAVGPDGRIPPDPC